MTDVTIREIQDLRELADPPAPRPEPDPDKTRRPSVRQRSPRRARADRPFDPGALDHARLRARLSPGLRVFGCLRARLGLARLGLRHFWLRLRLGARARPSRARGCSSSGVHSGTSCPRRSSSALRLARDVPGARRRVRPCLVLGVARFQPCPLGRLALPPPGRRPPGPRPPTCACPAMILMSVSACAVARSSAETSRGAAALALAPAITLASSWPRSIPARSACSSRICKAEIASCRMASSSGFPLCPSHRMTWCGSVIPAASR